MIALGVRRGHIFARSLVHSRSFVRQYKVINAFHWGLRDVIKSYTSILDRQVLGRRTGSSYIVKGY